MIYIPRGVGEIKPSAVHPYFDQLQIWLKRPADAETLAWLERQAKAMPTARKAHFDYWSLGSAPLPAPAPTAKPAEASVPAPQGEPVETATPSNVIPLRKSEPSPSTLFPKAFGVGGRRTHWLGGEVR